jgi:ATP-dependent exoDNAse (exonuclease V) beta subunit
VLTRPDNEIASAETVCPGLHRIEGRVPGSEFDVVWWDPAALNLSAEPPFGLRRQELISKDVEPEVVAAGQLRYRDWLQGRERAVADGRTPLVRVRTATEWAAAEAASGRGSTEALASSSSIPGQFAFTWSAPVEVIALDTEAGRPSGPRFGTLVHAALATVPLDCDLGTIAQVVATQGRIVGATADEIAWAAQVIGKVLAHPLLDAARRAGANGRCLREMPLTVTKDGTLIEGVVDLAFDTGDGYQVVDFKSDRAEGEALARYERQAALYADAIARATGQPARAFLFQL